MPDTPTSSPIRVVTAPGGFADWPGLLSLLHTAYASMEGRIDPPSSLLRMDAEQLERKSREETLILAFRDHILVGCAFAARRPDAIYVGKLAVRPECQQRGVGRRLMAEAEELARAHGLSFVELETRIELVENRATFEALGFRKTAETSHPGYSRATSITMRKAVASPEVSLRKPAPERPA